MLVSTRCTDGQHVLIRPDTLQHLQYSQSLFPVQDTVNRCLEAISIHQIRHMSHLSSSTQEDACHRYLSCATSCQSHEEVDVISLTQENGCCIITSQMCIGYRGDCIRMQTEILLPAILETESLFYPILSNCSLIFA